MDPQARGYGIAPSSTPAPQQILPGDRAYTKSSGRRNQYFVPGDGVRREVITADICRYLDNDATVKPGTYQGRDGYMLYAYRNLTSAMLEDIRRDSSAYHHEQKTSRRPPAERRDLNTVQEYERSKVYQHRHNEPGTPSPVGDYQTRPAPGADYNRQQYYQSESGYPTQHTGGGFPPQPRAQNYPPGYPGPQAVPDPRAQPPYDYHQQYGHDVQPGYAYPQHSAAQPQPGRPSYIAQPQVGQRDPNQDYVDPRGGDPRHDPRGRAVADPRQYITDPRADPRQPQDPRFRR